MTRHRYTVGGRTFTLTPNQEEALAYSVTVGHGASYGVIRRGYPPEHGYLTEAGLARLRTLGLVAKTRTRTGDRGIVSVILSEEGEEVALEIAARFEMEMT